ncbi:MAG: YraN family protein [Actinomycetota bacterium]
MDRRHLQMAGEDAASRHLRRRGMRILHRNWRIARGELDIVAREGRTLVFVEVKTRARDDFVEPFEGVHHAKRRRLRRLAEAYCATEAPRFDRCRFDVISVVADRGALRVEHLVDAF